MKILGKSEQLKGEPMSEEYISRQAVLERLRPLDNERWRNLPPTQKQLNYIAEMQEFSEFPLPEFKGKTRGEASDYINKWQRKAHEGFVDDNAGDRV